MDNRTIDEVRKNEDKLINEIELLEQENKIYKEVIDNLKDKLMEYFEVGRDSYFYVLTRDKSAFAYGTMSFDDFIEFSEEQVDDIVDFLKEVDMNKIGDRAVAIRDSNENEVNIYGYGKYLGEKKCPKLAGLLNPCIELENGKIVWGCECWWGNADRIEKEIIKSKRVNVVEVEHE